MYLADTNIFLEALLEQEKAQSVRLFLQTTDLREIFITDLSLHSIGIILFRLKEHTVFSAFLDDLMIDGMGVLSLAPDDLKGVSEVAQKFVMVSGTSICNSVTYVTGLNCRLFDAIP